MPSAERIAAERAGASARATAANQRKRHACAFFARVRAARKQQQQRLNAARAQRGACVRRLPAWGWPCGASRPILWTAGILEHRTERLEWGENPSTRGPAWGNVTTFALSCCCCCALPPLTRQSGSSASSMKPSSLATRPNLCASALRDIVAEEQLLSLSCDPRGLPYKREDGRKSRCFTCCYGC